MTQTQNQTFCDTFEKHCLDLLDVAEVFAEGITREMEGVPNFWNEEIETEQDVRIVVQMMLDTAKQARLDQEIMTAHQFIQVYTNAMHTFLNLPNRNPQNQTLQ